MVRRPIPIVGFMIDLDVNAFRALSDPRRELTVARLQTHRRVFRNRIPRRGGGLFGGTLPLPTASSRTCITNHDHVRTHDELSLSLFRCTHIFTYVAPIKKYTLYDLYGISR